MHELFVKTVWLWNEHLPLYKNEYNGTHGFVAPYWDQTQVHSAALYPKLFPSLKYIKTYLKSERPQKVLIKFFSLDNIPCNSHYRNIISYSMDIFFASGVHRFPSLPWDFILYPNDPAAHHDQCGRCRIRTRNRCYSWELSLLCFPCNCWHISQV